MVRIRDRFKLGVRGKISIFLFLHKVTLASAKKKRSLFCFAAKAFTQADRAVEIKRFYKHVF